MSHAKQWLVVKQPTHVDELRLKQARQLKRLKRWARLKALKNRRKDIKNNINVLNANYKPCNNNWKLYVVGYVEPKYNSR